MMRLYDLFAFSRSNLYRRRGRTVLTVTGVVIGCCAIIIMVSLGLAVNQSTDKMISEWGELTRIDVMSSYDSYFNEQKLPPELVGTIASLPNVQAVTPAIRFDMVDGAIVAGDNRQYQSTAVYEMMGVDFTALAALDYTLQGETVPRGARLSAGRVPVLVSANTPYSFINTNKHFTHPDYYHSAYDEKGNIDLQNPLFDVARTPMYLQFYYGYDESGTPETQEYELVVVGTFTTAPGQEAAAPSFLTSVEVLQGLQREYYKLQPGSATGTTGYNQIVVKIDHINNVDEVEQAIKRLGGSTYSLNQVRTEMQAQVAQGQMMLGGLAAISLLVAALNISNTMTMAIVERTREIGIMKVLGCRLQDIRRMFLIEAAIIGALGGGLGAALSCLLSALLNNLPGWLSEDSLQSTSGLLSAFGISAGTQNEISVIPPWLLLSALAFATVVGVLSGLHPSRQACEISSLEAIRRE